MDSEIYLHSWYIEIAQRIISVEVSLIHVKGTTVTTIIYSFSVIHSGQYCPANLTSVKMSPLILSITNFLFFQHRFLTMSK